MQVGVCSWTFGDISIEQVAQKVSALGFDGLELHGDLVNFNAASINQLMSEHQLTVFSLTPDNVDIVHCHSDTRIAAIDYYKRLIDFAADLQDKPKVSCHGDVGKVSAFTSQAEEQHLLFSSMQQICQYAEQKGIEVVFEVLNRYEANLINNAAQAMQLVQELRPAKLAVLLDCYHMNIEEPDISKAISHCGSDLGLFHIADSNRRGIGFGHTDFSQILNSLKTINYQGPVIIEISAPGPNPFTPNKEGDYLKTLESDLSHSLQWLRENG